MMNNAAKILAGFFLGAVFGVSTGLLMAPTTGRTARKKIGRHSKKLAKKVAGYIGVEKKKTGGASRKKSSAPVASSI